VAIPRKTSRAKQPWYHYQHLCDADRACTWWQVNCDRFRETSFLIASYANWLIAFPWERIVLNRFHIHFGVVNSVRRNDEKAADVVLLRSHIAAWRGSARRLEHR
jgi:hypothetical protein